MSCHFQCCNDVVQERYAPELKYDIALRLAALHIHQHAISNNMASKVTVKAIEWVQNKVQLFSHSRLIQNVRISNNIFMFHRQEFGLERFVPVSLMSTMKRKELRKLISHFLKLNHNLSPTGQKSLTSLQAKLYYLNIISELPSYGAKCFSTNIRVCFPVYIQVFRNGRTIRYSFIVSWIEVYTYFVCTYSVVLMSLYPF